MFRVGWIIVFLFLGLWGPLGTMPAVYSQEQVHSIPFRLIEVEDPILEDYTFLLRSSGRSVLSLTPPLSSQEILQQLEKLTPENRSEAWQATYVRIRKALGVPPQYQEGVLGVSAHPEVALEIRSRSNKEVEWIRPEKESPAAFSLPLEFYFSNTFYGRGDIILRNDPYFYNVDSSYWGTNLITQTERIDLNLPLRAFASVGGSYWLFQLGRDRISFGSARTGNLTISDTPDYYDFARLSLFGYNFKYTFFITQLPLETPSYFFKPGYDVRRTGENQDISQTTQRYLYLHRFDVRLWEKLSLSISEGVLVGNSPLELQYLNPFHIYHSLFSWREYPRWGLNQGDMTGSVLSLEVEWTWGEGLRFYGQMVMNQFATPYELSKWPEDNNPNGMGWLAGLEYNGNLRGWQSTLYVEGVYTDPYLYVLSSPFASFIWMRRLSELTSKPLRYTWIGHPEGRDTVLLLVGAQLKKDPLWIHTALSFTARGEHGLLWDWEKGEAAVEQTTPSGVAEQHWQLSTRVDWKVHPPLTLTFYVAGAYIQNFQHVRNKTSGGGEVGVIVRYRL